MKANRHKRHRQNIKRKNLGTANYSDFDSAGQERIREQVLLSLKDGHCEISDSTSVASSITTPSPSSPLPMQAEAAALEVGCRAEAVSSSSMYQSWQLDLSSSL